MKQFLIVSLLLILLCISNSPVYASLMSNFNLGDEGWTTRTYYSPTNTNPPLTSEPPVLWGGSGGNPDGYIYLPDPGNGSTQFKAPNAWMGDWTSYIGGTFSFDLMVSEIQDSSAYQNIPNIYIHSGSVILAWRETITPMEDEWTHFERTLSSPFWEIWYGDGRAFDELMANVTEVTVRGESFDGYDVFGIDNIRVSPVPEPTTMILFSIGLLGLVGFNRKNK